MNFMRYLTVGQKKIIHDILSKVSLLAFILFYNIFYDMPYDTAQFLITQGASSQIYNTCGYWISLVCIFMFSGLFVAPLARTNTCVEEAVVSWPFPLKQPSKRPGGIWTCWQLHRISSYTLSTKYLNNGKQQLGSAWSIFKYHRRIVFLIAFSLSCYASAIINNLMPFKKKCTGSTMELV